MMEAWRQGQKKPALLADERALQEIQAEHWSPATYILMTTPEAIQRRMAFMASEENPNAQYYEE